MRIGCIPIRPLGTHTPDGNFAAAASPSSGGPICSEAVGGVPCSCCMELNYFGAGGFKCHYFREGGVKSAPAMPTLRKRPMPPTPIETRSSKRKKVHHEVIENTRVISGRTESLGRSHPPVNGNEKYGRRAARRRGWLRKESLGSSSHPPVNSNDRYGRRGSLQSHTAAEKDDGGSAPLSCLPQKKKKVDHNIRAEHQDMTGRRMTLRSHTAVKKPHGEDLPVLYVEQPKEKVHSKEQAISCRGGSENEGCRVFRVRETRKRVHQKVRADPQDVARRRASLRSNTVVKKDDPEGGRVSDSQKREDEGKRAALVPIPHDNLTYPEGAAKLLTGLQELSQSLEDIDSVFQKCRELSAVVKRTDWSQGAGEKSLQEIDAIFQKCVLLSSNLECTETREEGDIVIKMGSPYNEILGVVRGLEAEVRNRDFIGDHKFDSMVTEIDSDSEDENLNALKRNGSHLGPEEDSILTHEGMVLDDDEGTAGKKMVEFSSLTQKTTDGEVRQPFSEGQLGLQGAGSAAMEPIICKPLACMQKYGPWSTRIRKDGKRWRRRGLGWSHIKRKYLVYKRIQEARLGKVEVIVESLLRRGRQREEIGFPDDLPDDEDVPYEAYRRSCQMPKNADPDEEELEDLFKEMGLALDRGWEKRETVDNAVTVYNGGCSHNYVFYDDVGRVCEKCGLVGQDIQSIFLLDCTRPNKKAAIVPVEEPLEDPESQDDPGLSFAQGGLPRVNLTLHPYYEEQLHPHQKEGILFLARNLLGDPQLKLPPGGCILAHAPGTGKSCLTVSFVQSFLTAYPKGRPMIVAPKIMLRPWESEFHQWNVEEIPIYNLNETFKRGGPRKSSRERDELTNVISSTPYYREKLEGRRLRLMKKWLERRSVLLVSYNLFAGLVLAGLNDEHTGSVKQQICEALLDGPELLILDEGHFPRTKRTKISQALMRVRTSRRILLSGTLFQNNFRELFNLMKLARHNFMSLSPEFAPKLKRLNGGKQQPPSDEDNNHHFAGRTHRELDPIGRECEEQMFMDEIGDKLEEFVEGAENFEEINTVLRKLRALTTPIVHWYTGQILESLPGLCEFVVYLNLSAHQHKLLSHLQCKSSFEEKARLAEVCIHPELLKYEENLAKGHSAAAYNAQQDPSKGVKTAFLFNLLRLCCISGERVLIFCQTLSPLTLIESMLSKLLGWSRGKEILRLDGTMPLDERQSMIDQFNEGSSRACVMLASITACKEGISLVGASRVVILDVLYNPSVVRQAVSRAFRIGQRKRVYVYRLVAADTKEETIFQAAVQKDWLSRVLMAQSSRMMSGNSYHAEKILQEDSASDDGILQKMMRSDSDNRIDRVCRYNSDFSK